MSGGLFRRSGGARAVSAVTGAPCRRMVGVKHRRVRMATRKTCHDRCLVGYNLEWGLRMVTVSVVMPAYNAAETIDRAIDGVLAQRFPDFELLVVDDCSTDATVERVRSRQAGDDRIRLLRLPRNGGPSAARNAALDVARGEWIALLDADDTWRPDRLERLVAERECDMVADQMIGWDAVAGVETGPYMRRSRIGEVDLVRLLRTGYGYDFGYLKPSMRRAFLMQAGIRYPEGLRHGEDYVTYARCLTAGARFRVLSYAGYVYTTPVGRVSDASSPHSHTRIDDLMLAAAIEALASEVSPSLTPDDRAAFAWRVRYLRTRPPFNAFVAACRRHSPAGVIRALFTAPASIVRHLTREVWALWFWSPT